MLTGKVLRFVVFVAGVIAAAYIDDKLLHIKIPMDTQLIHKAMYLALGGLAFGSWRKG